MRLREKLWNPYILVFISSGSIMVLELSAGRLVAPRIGVSIYTWTSIIGVVLAGISLGNYIGGRLSDRYGSMWLLGLLFSSASLATLLALWLNNDLHDFQLPINVPMMVWILMYIAAVFLLPSIILGCVAPVVVRLSLKDLSHAGSTVGKIYAWSSAGSIAGTFLAGFFFISRFGTKATFVGVASVLMLLGIWFLWDLSWRKTLVRISLALALFAGGIFWLDRTGFLRSECMNETNYFCINVREIERDGRQVHELLLDRLVHSYNDLEDPTYLGYAYEQTYAALIEPLLGERGGLDSLFIGGGGYTFPRYVQTFSPDSHLVVVEIDEGVTEAAHDWLVLDRDTDIITYNMDARGYLIWEAEPESFDVVFGDAFNDYSVPYHLTTLEVTKLIDTVLRDDGLYMANIIDGGEHGHFLRAFVATQREVFEHVLVIPSSSGWQISMRTTFVIVASHYPIDLSAVSDAFPVLAGQELDEYMAEAPYVVLTDDYVPVDSLMAPVVQASFGGTAWDPEITARIRERIHVVGYGAAGLVVLALIAIVYWRIRRADTAES